MNAVQAAAYVGVATATLRMLGHKRVIPFRYEQTHPRGRPAMMFARRDLARYVAGQITPDARPDVLELLAALAAP